MINPVASTIINRSNSVSQLDFGKGGLGLQAEKSITPTLLDATQHRIPQVTEPSTPQILSQAHKNSQPNWSRISTSTLKCVSSGAQNTLRALAYGIGSGLWAGKIASDVSLSLLRSTSSTAGTTYKGIKNYLEAIQPADTKLITHIHDQLTNMHIASRHARRVIHIRSALNQERLELLKQIGPNAAKTTEIQDAYRKSQFMQTNETDVFAKKIKEVHSKADQAGQKLLRTPTNQQARSAQATVKSLEHELKKIMEAIDATRLSHTEFQTQTKRALDLGIALQNAVKTTQIHASALHLNLGWSDWSAYCQELAAYAIQTTTPEMASLDRQTQVQQDLADAITQLSQLHQELKTADELQSTLAQRLHSLINLRVGTPTPEQQALLQLVQTEEIDENQIKQHIQDALNLNKQIQKDYNTARHLAACAVSYAQHTPTEQMLDLAESFTQKLVAIVTKLTSKEISLTQGNLLDFYQSTAHIAEEIGPETLLAKTAQYIHC